MTAAEELLVRRFTAPIVVLCGSTRFKDTYISEYARLHEAGHIVLSVGRLDPKHKLNNPDLKRRLDELHMRKIDLADWVWVLDLNGYTGDSTKSEIAYANGVCKPVFFLSKAGPDFVADLPWIRNS